MEDIGNLAGIRGPSVYRHVGSKHELLAAIMTGTMERLLGAQQAAIVGDPDPREVVRRLVAAHVHYHALHRFETFVGNREIENLEPEPHRQVLRLRARYETTLRQVIARGTESGAFAIESARLASYALLDMGIGVSTWHDPRGRYSPDDLSRIYADMAVQMLTGPR